MLGLPLDHPPQHLSKAATARARDLEHPLIAGPVGAQYGAGFLDQRRRADDDLAIGKAQRALFGKQDRRTLGARLHRVRLVDEQDAGRVPSEVPWSLAGNDLERAAGEQAMQDRRAILAVINLARERTAQGRARLKRRLKVRNHVVAAVGLGRQQAQDRRRLIGDEVPESSGQKRGESDPTGLQQAHAFDLGVPDAVGDRPLIGPEPHRTRNCRRPLRQAHAGLDPGR